MVETMYYARGIGLASVQVGDTRRVVVLDVPDEDEKDRTKGKNLIALVNPEIVLVEGETTYEEGCLSLPGITADVDRAAKVKVQALDRDGNPFEIEAEGLLAIALQHEIDHLNGIIFIDRLSRLKRELVKRKYKKSLETEERAI
jgi:peptide deformylase